MRQRDRHEEQDRVQAHTHVVDVPLYPVPPAQGIVHGIVVSQIDTSAMGGMEVCGGDGGRSGHKATRNGSTRTRVHTHTQKQDVRGTAVPQDSKAAGGELSFVSDA